MGAGWGRVGDSWRAREQLARAEANYGSDRDAAQRVDQTELQGLRRQASSRGGDAESAAARHTALVAEQQLRAAMPHEQRGAEGGLRLEWLREQQLAAQQRRAAQQECNADYTHEPRLGPHQGPHQGRGHGSGMGR